MFYFKISFSNLLWVYWNRPLWRGDIGEGKTAHIWISSDTPHKWDLH